MSQNNICRLCVKSSGCYKSLYDVNGQPNSLYEIILKYFHPTVLNIHKYKHCPGICQKCFDYIWEFCNFLKSVREAQTQLFEDIPDQVLIKQEFPESQIDSTLDEFLEAEQQIKIFENFLNSLTDRQHSDELLEDNCRNKTQPDCVSQNPSVVKDELELIDVPDDVQGHEDEEMTSVSWYTVTEIDIDPNENSHKKLPVNYECELCGCVCTSCEDLRMHLTNECESGVYLKDNLPHLRCEVCGELFATTRIFDLHQETHNLKRLKTEPDVILSEERVPDADENSVISKNEKSSCEDLRMHLTNECESGVYLKDKLLQLTCEVCGELFATRRIFDLHQETHNLKRLKTEPDVILSEEDVPDSDECSIISKNEKFYPMKPEKVLSASKKSYTESKDNASKPRKSSTKSKNDNTPKPRKSSKKSMINDLSISIKSVTAASSRNSTIMSASESIKPTETVSDKVRAHLRDHILSKLKK